MLSPFLLFFLGFGCEDSRFSFVATARKKPTIYLLEEFIQMGIGRGSRRDWD
jgi:hypothetical protein